MQCIHFTFSASLWEITARLDDSVLKHLTRISTYSHTTSSHSTSLRNSPFNGMCGPVPLILDTGGFIRSYSIHFHHRSYYYFFKPSSFLAHRYFSEPQRWHWLSFPWVLMLPASRFKDFPLVLSHCVNYFHCLESNTIKYWILGALKMKTKL